MELTQLHYFVTVARHESLSQAARELFVSQPALSQSIARLEQSLGVRLFDRVQGRLKLNEAGRILLRRADTVFAQLSAAQDELRGYCDSQNGHILVSSAVIDAFVSVINAYLEQCSAVRVSYNLTSRQTAISDLLENRVEFALVPDPVTDARIEPLELYEEEVFAVVGPPHPFWGRRSVPLTEIARMPVGCNPSDGDEAFVERLFAAVGARPNIITDSNESQVLVHMTALGKCLGFVPARVAAKHLREGGVQQPVRMEPPVRRSVYILRRAGQTLSEQSQAFFDFAVQFCREENRAVTAYLQEYYREEA